MPTGTAAGLTCHRKRDDEDSEDEEEVQVQDEDEDVAVKLLVDDRMVSLASCGSLCVDSDGVAGPRNSRTVFSVDVAGRGLQTAGRSAGYWLQAISFSPVSVSRFVDWCVGMNFETVA